MLSAVCSRPLQSCSLISASVVIHSWSNKRKKKTKTCCLPDLCYSFSIFDSVRATKSLETRDVYTIVRHYLICSISSEVCELYSCNQSYKELQNEDQRLTNNIMALLYTKFISTNETREPAPHTNKCNMGGQWVNYKHSEVCQRPSEQTLCRLNLFDERFPIRSLFCVSTICFEAIWGCWAVTWFEIRIQRELAHTCF